MTAVLFAILIASIFTGSSLLTLFGSPYFVRGRSLAIAVAAGVLLALAFGDLFPEGLELTGKRAVAGFISSFAVLFLIESFTHAHTHHAPHEPLQTHAHLPFLLGLALHNVADGFAVGIAARLGGSTSAAIGFGVLIHQIPVGVSFAAVLAATNTPARVILRAAVALGAVIPLATAFTVAVPPLSDTVLGVLVSVAGGILAYVSTAHLLPEAQAEHPGRTTGIVFTLTLLLMTTALLTILAES
jgi:zinc transporter ZupT